MGSLVFNAKRTVRQLDFAKFLQGDVKAQGEFCQELVQSFSNEGFVKLVNHGISEEDVLEVFEWNKRFFALSEEAKSKASHPAAPNPHRGYSHIGQEKLSLVKDYEKGVRKGTIVYDIKESFDQGPANDGIYPNRWPDDADLPGFRTYMEWFYEQCHWVHLELLRAMAIGLGLAPIFFQDLCRQNSSELRLNHYPGCAADTLRQGAKRISEHTDFGTVTLLFQDAVGGLEIEDQANAGSYFPVPFGQRSEMIVNIGDCMQRWTNDSLRSTSHRVVLPPQAEEWVDDRYSVAYFAKPDRNMVVGSLPELLTEGATPKYDNITAWEYNQEKLILTY